MRRKLVGSMLAALVLFVGSVVQADDEQIANHLYKKLSEAKQQGSLKDFSLDMEVKDGVVFFSGRVATKTQKSMVLTLAQKAQKLGVVEIRDGITVAAKPAQKPVEKAEKPVQKVAKAIQKVAKPVQKVAKPVQKVEQSALKSSRVQQASANKPVQDFDYLSGGKQTVAPPAQVAAPAQVAPAAQVAAPVQLASLPARPAALPPTVSTPLPVQGQALQAPSYMPAAAASGARYDAPGLPNYAWPSYAPHPNYGAVTYPKTYSPSAWPYIGPFYPYPQVPLGWRKVTLEWDDGWWYLDFNDR